MEEHNNITPKDKSILTLVLLIIFLGAMITGLIGVIYSLSG